MSTTANLRASPLRDEGELVLLANHAMRARRRPWAIVGVWAWQGVFALMTAWPAASLVESFYGRHPRGDAPLWEAGALPLLDLGAHVWRTRSALTTHAATLMSLAIVLGLFPAAALLASIGYTTRDLHAPPLGRLVARAYQASRPMVLVFACTTLAQLSLALVGLKCAFVLDDLAYDRLGEAKAEQLGMMGAAIFVAAAAAAGLLQDLARAAIVRFRVGGLAAMRLAWSTFRRAPVALFWSWGWRALASLVPLAFGALVAERMGGQGGLALLALAALHQVIALSRVALRASWLARALRGVDAAHRVLR